LSSATRPKNTSGLADGDTSKSPSQPFSLSGNALSNIGTAIGAIGEIQGGINALSTGKMNAKLSKRYGQESFDAIMADVRQRVGSFQVQTGASGLISQSASDVAYSGVAKGAKDAATSKRNYDIQAANQKYEGRMAYAKAIQGAGQSLLSMK